MAAFPPNPSAPVTVAQFDSVVTQIDGVFGNVARRLHTMRSRLYAIEAQFALQASGRTPRMPVTFNSQYGEDALVWEAMNGPLSGLYIEVGAFDGRSLSVSYALDAVGWDGLLVEAIPERFEQCTVNRPHARVEHAALGPHGAAPTCEFTVVNDSWGGMLSYSDANQKHKQDIGGMASRTVTVPTATLDGLLDKHFPGREVDVAVIDVEGAEPHVLSGFDLLRWKPKLLIIEDNTHGEDKRLDQCFAGKPYTMATWIEVNRVYVRNDLEAMRRFLAAQD